MIKIKMKRCLVSFFSFIIVPSLFFAGAEASSRELLLPIAESEEVVSSWLTDSGFELSRVPLEGLSLQLKAVKGNECWSILLRPHSALATEIISEYTQEGKPDKSRIEALWTHLKSYSYPEEKDSDQEAPSSVLSKRRFSVCIKAIRDHKNIQFSGLIIDEEGVIISTAHDLKGIRNVTVISNNGEEMDGYIVAIDSYRDLALIKINMRVTSSVSLAEGKNLLIMGERVYSIGCPNNSRDIIHYGTISGPPRKANELPLWQVNMKVFHGSSGSPVFDIQGNFVGIVKGRYRGTDSVGFLIPLETIMEFLREIKPT